MRQPDGRFKVPEMQLLYARSLEAASRFDEAKAAYAAAVEICPGEEARCRRALLLRRSGEPETALELFQAIVRSVAKADPAYLRTQREWFEIAKREIGGEGRSFTAEAQRRSDAAKKKTADAQGS